MFNIYKLAVICFVIAIIALQPILSFSKSYYVNSNTGNDKFSGMSPSKPKNTIQAAINLVRPGDHVFVMNGTYTNACSTCNVVVITKGGSPGKYVTLSNYGNDHPVLKFDGWAGILVTDGASYLNITGFEIEGPNAKISLKDALKQPQSCANKKGDFDPKYNGNGIAITGVPKRFSHHILILRNIVHDCSGGGIGASHADYVNVNENLIYNNAWYSIFGTSGIAFYQFFNLDYKAGYHNHIRRNRCFNNKSLVPCIKACKITDGNGIIVDDFRHWQNASRPKPYAGKTLIENNICWFNGGTAIHSFQSDHVDIINNTAYCNSKTKESPVGQILGGGSSDMQIVNNIIVTDSDNVFNSNFMNKKIVYANNLHYNITHPTKIDAIMVNSTCITGQDPMFVNPAASLTADFSLKPSSPAIDKGNRTFYGNGDFNNRKRPKGKAADIGAFEY